ncbi:MAG: TatD family hydrolase [Deltaproteobacteria bacterium]|nr:TatD family hydrolase [Deltaproteobacteria bacterium]
MWTDAHCHLDRDNTAHASALAIIDRARAAKVQRLVAVGVGHEGRALTEVQALAEADEDIYFTAGIHPHDAKDASEAAIAAVEGALSHRKCVALGEVGLDYYYDNSPRAEQRALFERMIGTAIAHKKKLMLHVRDAHDEALEMLAARLPKDLKDPGIVHCFTEGRAIAERYLALGFYLSIPGIVTFKTAAPLQDAVVHMPRDKVLVETDSPYLAPIPMRGKKNEPAFVPYVGKKIAELWGTSEADVATLTSANAARIFGW